MTTGIHLPTALQKVLSGTAFERVMASGGCTSISALHVDMRDQHRKEWEKDKGFRKPLIVKRRTL
jgi:hypothetical protein